MAKGPSKNAATIQRLLEERRQYEAWLARLNSAANATPEGVRVRVGADYAARLKAVNEELKIHADAAQQLVAQRRELHTELVRKERAAAERLAEAELRHAVGEYDEAQWTQVHKDALSELVAAREELQSLQGDIEQLEQLNAMVQSRTAGPAGDSTPATSAPASSPAAAAPRAGSPPRPPARPDVRRGQVDELAFLKSVTEDEKGGAPSPRRASGAQYQPAELLGSSRTGAAGVTGGAATPPPSMTPEPQGGDQEPVKTLKCQECGTMNLPTEWYCEQCGAELAAL
jgi:hypothetical protein